MTRIFRTTELYFRSQLATGNHPVQRAPTVYQVQPNPGHQGGTEIVDLCEQRSKSINHAPRHNADDLRLHDLMLRKRVFFHQGCHFGLVELDCQQRTALRILQRTGEQVHPVVDPLFQSTPCARPFIALHDHDWSFTSLRWCACLRGRYARSRRRPLPWQSCWTPPN
jgi:hypothetical protein